MDNQVIKTCTFCRRAFTMNEWNTLHLVGHQDWMEEGDQGMELRNCCSCLSTILIFRTPEDRQKHSA